MRKVRRNRDIDVIGDDCIDQDNLKKKRNVDRNHKRYKWRDLCQEYVQIDTNAVVDVFMDILSPRKQMP